MNAAFDHDAGGALQRVLILIKIKAPVANTQAQGVPRGGVQAAFYRHIHHIVLKFIRQLPIRGFDVKKFAELPGKGLRSFQEVSTLFGVFFPAKGGTGKLLREPGDFCLLHTERLQRAGVEGAVTGYCLRQRLITRLKLGNNIVGQNSFSYRLPGNRLAGKRTGKGGTGLRSESPQTLSLRVVFMFYLRAGFIQPAGEIVNRQRVDFTGLKAKPSRQ